jgi:hypothetical protein
MGEELATLLELKNYIIAPDIAEATVALRTTKFNSELGFYKVFLERDALQIVEELKKEEKNTSKYGHLIKDIQGILKGLQKWQVNHNSRNLNGTTHQIAKHVLYLSEEQCFPEKTPHIFLILFLHINVIKLIIYITCARFQ